MGRRTRFLITLTLLISSCRETKHGSPPSSGTAPLPPGTDISPANYVPPVIYPVKRYEVALDGISISPPIHEETSPTRLPSPSASASAPDKATSEPLADSGTVATETLRRATSEGLSTPLSGFAQSTRHVTELQLRSGQGSHFYTGFPLSVRFGLKVEGDASKMLVNFGLVQAPPKDFPKERYKELKSCSIGSGLAVHDGSAAPAGQSQAFEASLNIPEDCLGDKTSEHMILTMIFNPDGAVQSAAGQGPIFLALDRETTEASGLCLKFDAGAKDCQNELLIERSPGVNIKVTDFSSDSSLAVLPYLDPEAIFKKKAEMPSPFVSTSGSLVLEGATPSDLDKYSVTMNYDICAGDGSSENLTGDCSGPGWQKLSAIAADSTNTLDKISNSQELKGFKADKPLNFSNMIHAMGASYKALSSKNKGAWAAETFFRVRACAKVLKDGKDVAQVNLDSQATDGDATADDCMIFPLFKMEETEATNTNVCGNSDSSLDSDGECDKAFNDPNLKVINPVANYVKSWGGAWGDQNKLRVSFEAGPRLVMSATKIATRIGTSISSRGYINTDLFAADLSMFLDLTGADQHYIEPSIKAFGAKIYGSRINMESEYEYSLPLDKWIGGNGKNKTIEKSVTTKIEKASTDLDAPKILNKGDIQNKPSALFVKELCGSAQVPVYIITVSLDVCGELGAYLGLGAYARVRQPFAEEAKMFPGGKRVAVVGMYFIPAVAASARGQVSIGIVITKVGVGGEMRLVEVALPVTLTAKAGNYEHTVRSANGAKRTTMGLRANANFDTSLDLAWLGGRLYVFAEYWGFDWCKAWTLPYPCHFGWKKVDQDVVSFNGGETRFNLIHQDFFDRTWEPYLVSNGEGCNAVLEKGEELKTGEKLCSTNGDYRLDMQEDGNLVVYHKTFGATWASFTQFSGSVRAKLEDDGNFKLWDLQNNLKFETKTSGKGGAKIILLNDGRLQVLNEENETIWNARDTSGFLDKGCLPVLTGGQTLNRGQSVCSVNKRFNLIMEDGGNLVVYQNSNHEKVWEAGANGRGGVRADMQEDGNFVIYTKDNAVPWSSDTWRAGPSYLELSDEGVLQVKRLNDAEVLWSSK